MTTPTFGKPPFSHLQYCVRCCMPETNEGMQFDEMGVCKACRSSEQKMRIDWTDREKELRRLLERYRTQSGSNYDCIVPISGGKDSAFQLHVLTQIYGVKPLAVTFSHNLFSETGRWNLENILEKLNVDHLMFTPNRGLVNKLARRSLYEIGDACWHCHAGVGAFPLQVAVKFEIPLVIYGESPAEFSGRATYHDRGHESAPTFANNWTRGSVKVLPEHMVDDRISPKDVQPFRLPTDKELEAAHVLAIFLGDYIFWDAERQMEFLVKTYDWREDDVEGTYKKYKSVECIMPGVHDYTKYLKRGFGRGSDMASQDVRAGLLTREEGFELAKKYDPRRPEVLDYYLKITGFTEEEFLAIVKAHRRGKARDLP